MKSKVLRLAAAAKARVVSVVRRPSPSVLGRPLSHPAELVHPEGLEVPPPQVESDGPQPLDVRPRRVRGRADGELPAPFRPPPRRPDGSRP